MNEFHLHLGHETVNFEILKGDTDDFVREVTYDEYEESYVEFDMDKFKENISVAIESMRVCDPEKDKEEALKFIKILTLPASTK